MPRPLPEPTPVTREMLRGWPLPKPSGGKNARGSILVIGGSTETLGAVLLAAEAAMRVGAGKLQVATVESLAPFAAAALPEALVRALPETPDGAISAKAADIVRDLAEAADAVLIGPGMADTEETQAFGERLLPHLEGPLALDALGLACVTAAPACLHHLAGRVVLTPNPTEIAFALHVEEDEIEDDPAGSALELADRARAVVGLGGAVSWIGAPDGALWRDESGEEGLGVSGSGDVRAGITGGLLARGADPAQAAVWAAYLHGRTGERLSSSVGPLGFLARELPAEIPRALAEIIG
ncbi:NAD(P)H-hydrate dehydratase [Blastococcus saxobsidens]|uniref:ADP-dependent (S)-NAD(P)H-hydrate dehydratase n=1 Tax=Blastococcus saxobsidens TaxID=138336 RepID=A0A6L9W336_9ACTN|nr:NAD(P)H-hydrate dehydratase [Blastococcus saxobsidens]NEK85901.1 NAD(P)H-hydrate dehydratase [Blastococcus saxobsidens]